MGIQCLLLADTIDEDVTEKEECDNDSDNSAASSSDYIISTGESSDSSDEYTVDNTSFRSHQETASTRPTPDEEEKFIVFESKLLDLLNVCSVCCEETTGVISWQ